MEKHAFDPACCLGERLQTLSRAELTALAETICRILTERGAYHGGIRPDNISRAGDGTVGLGAPARTDTKDWTTEELEFMAPEVFWSGSLDASADVYSLGLLLYAGVMGGRLPFYPDDRAPQPEDMAAALRRRMNGEALPLARKAGRDLAQIIARATQCKPADRYATPAELCAALEPHSRKLPDRHIQPPRAAREHELLAERLGNGGRDLRQLRLAAAAVADLADLRGQDHRVEGLDDTDGEAVLQQAVRRPRKSCHPTGCLFLR